MGHDGKCVCCTECTEEPHGEGLFPNSQGTQPVICCLMSKMIISRLYERECKIPKPSVTLAPSSCQSVLCNIYILSKRTSAQ